MLRLRVFSKITLPKSIEKFLAEYLQIINSFEKLFNGKYNFIKNVTTLLRLR